MQEAGMSEQREDGTVPQARKGGAGPEGTIPANKQGIGVGAGREPNTFEPEEDPDATEEADE
jgi:hypothetical protein